MKYTDKKSIEFKYFSISQTHDMLQAEIDDSKCKIIDEQSNDYFKSYECLDVSTDDGFKPGWMIYSEIEKKLKFNEVKNFFPNKERHDWASEIYTYQPELEEFFKSKISDCEKVLSENNNFTFYIKDGVCNFILHNRIPNGAWQELIDSSNDPSFIGIRQLSGPTRNHISNKVFLINYNIWKKYQDEYSISYHNLKKIMKHFIGKYTDVPMLTSNNFENYFSIDMVYDNQIDDFYTKYILGDLN